MKSIEKLQVALENLTQEFSESKNSVVSDDIVAIHKFIVAIHKFIVDNTPVKKGDLSVWECVTKNKKDIKWRPNMANVFHDNEAKAAVGTDAHILFINPSEYIDSTEKPKGCDQQFEYNGYTGLVRDKYGKPLKDGKYPLWRTVFPKDTMRFEIRADLKQTRDIAKSTCKLSGRARFNICINRELDIWVGGDFVDFVIRAGIDGWQCSKESPNRRALVKEWEDGRKMLLMPVLPAYKSENGYDSTNLVVFW